MKRPHMLLLTLIVLLVCLVSAAALAQGAVPAPAMQQQETVDAAVRSLFTQTAQAQQQLDMTGTIAAAFGQALTGTAQATRAATTPTVTPTPTFAVTAAVKTATAAAIQTEIARTSTAPAAGTPSTPPNASVRVRAILHAQPDNASPDVVEVMRGSSLLVIGRSADSLFFYVQTPGGVTGWIDAALVDYPGERAALPVIDPFMPDSADDAPAATPTRIGADASRETAATISVSAVNLRAEPRLGADAVVRLRQGDPVTILGTTEDRAYVFVRAVDGQQGWIAARFVTFDGALTDLPVVVPD